MKIENFVLGMVHTNCYLVSSEETKEGFIVDLATYSPEMVNHIKKSGIQIKGILLTHGHFDHIMGIEEFIKEIPTTVYAHEDEKELLKDPALNLSVMRIKGYGIEEVHFLKDAQNLNLAGFELQAIHIPGHTPGGCSYYLPKEGVVFTGDSLFYHSIGRTDFPYGETSLLVDSIKGKLLVLPEDTKVLPGHGDATSIANERKNNPYLD